MDAVFPDKLLFHDSTTSPRNIILRALYAPRPRSGASHPLPVVLERRRPRESLVFSPMHAPRLTTSPITSCPPVRATSRTSPGYTSTMGARVRARRYARMRTCVICTGLWMASGAGTQRCRVAGVGGRRCVVCGGDREVGAGGGCADTSLMLRYCAMAFHAPASSRPKTSLSLPEYTSIPSASTRPTPDGPTHTASSVRTTPAFARAPLVLPRGLASHPLRHARPRRTRVSYPSPTSPSPGCGQRGVFDATLRACVVLVEVEMRACPAGMGGSDGPGGGGVRVGKWIATAGGQWILVTRIMRGRGILHCGLALFD
ncbi:hypothetical protein C8R46DRAFT_1115668 [Mycena filopes]|nr:hypothetical protein C8R46DRAFT_1115668 [Mycena filopes]